MSDDATDAVSGDALAEVGRIVLGEDPLDAILDRVVHLAQRAMPVQCEVSLTLLSPTQPTTVSFTGEVSTELDERQYDDDRGPCLDASASGEMVIVRDVTSDDRWPRYSKRAAELGVRSSLSVPLPVQRDVTGALNFYARETDAFSTSSIDIGRAFAGHAAIALGNAHHYESTVALARQMEQAMASRAVIEQAKGIIMRDRGCSADEAFDVLVALSQRAHLKLSEIARRLVEEVVRPGEGPVGG